MSRPVAVLLVVALAGCSLPGAGPAPTATAGPPPAIDVTVASAGPDATVEVALVPGPVEAATVTFRNGSTRTVSDLARDLGVNVRVPEDATSVEHDALVLDRQRHALTGNSSVTLRFDSPPRAAAVYFVATDDDGVRFFGTASCPAGDALTAVDIEVGVRGPGVGLQCGSPDARGRALSGAAARRPA